MEINYPVIGVVLLVVIVLIVFLIRRNVKDERDFEKDMNASESAETHKEDSI